MYQYDGLEWGSLREACSDLNLNYKHASAYIKEHKCTLAEYIRLHRFVVRGLIFNSIEAVALYLGVDPIELKSYLANGYPIDLAAHMIKRGLPIDYFTLRDFK